MPSNDYLSYKTENGRSALLLILLFLLALFRFYTAGYGAFAMVCFFPAIILYVYIAFRFKMVTFWALFIINYILFWFNKNNWLPSGIPLSLYNELLEFVLIAIAIIDQNMSKNFNRARNLMLFSLLIWTAYCVLELLNDTCNIGIDIEAWYNGTRGYALQFIYVLLVFSVYISTPKILKQYLWVWAGLAFFSAFYTWKQQNIGFTPAESSWLWNSGYVTHVINGGSLIRYFSTFNDAAAYGCNAAATAVLLVIVTFTSRFRTDRILFGVISVCVIWGMFASGTRTAIFSLGAGLALFIFLSKSIKIAVPFTILFAIAISILLFTNIGNGNQQIRRMRSAFNKEDASANVREINKATMRKYLSDAPWGIGLGMGPMNVPANNKFSMMATIPPDSEYVYIWIRTGRIGITLFIITTIIMFCGACWVVLFRIKNRSLMGIGAGLCGAFLAIHLGGYANQILATIPNGLLFYGGLAVVYILPYIEPEWIVMEEKRQVKLEEKKRLKLEKKLASRV